MSDDLKERVSKWLEQQGYPLEMRVAQELQQAGFADRVSVGSFYEDPHTGKYREVDVVAYHLQTGVKPSSTMSFNVLVSFLIECKKSTKPWVAFVVDDSPLNANEMGSVYHWPMTEVARDRIGDYLMFRWSEIGGTFYAPGATAYGLVEAATIGPNPQDAKEASQKVMGTGNASNRAYDGLQQLLNALDARLKMLNDVERSSNMSDRKRGTVCVPVLILDGPLFECRLSGGVLDLTQVEQTTVVFRDRVVGFGVPRVLVVTANRLEQFARSAFSLASGICGAAQWWVDRAPAKQEE